MRHWPIDRRRFLARSCAALAAGPFLGARLAPAAVGNAGADDERVWVHTARHWKKLADKQVQCLLCPRRCVVADRERGSCGVRENRAGDYYTLVYGRPVSIHVDPIEKKPLFHFLPGTRAYSLATAGCNMQCLFCQNWQISQPRPEDVPARVLPPDRTAQDAAQQGAQSIAFTYSEPVIFFEYMHDTAIAGKRFGLRSVMITNGYIEADPMQEVCRDLAAVKIDLKAFTDEFYVRLCRAHLEPVLETLKLLRRLDKWTEIVVLILPTKNDSPDEIRRLAQWIKANLGPDVPVHFTRFHPTYMVQNLPPTPVATLERCRQIALAEGLHYVYVGNVIGHPGEHTYCPKCHQPVIERIGFTIVANRLAGGKCGSCGREIAGIWT